MNFVKMAAFVVAMLVLAPAALFARDIVPVVSADWLERNLKDPKLVVIDIRKPEEYRAGHVPGAVNVYFGTWVVKTFDIDNELPADDDLADIINGAGIAAGSSVVVVGRSDAIGELAAVTRVAWTLEYAGVENVTVLDGGFSAWEGDRKAISTDLVKPKPANAQFTFKSAIRANEDYLLKQREKAIILDTRLPDAFFGVTKADSVERPGRIKGAVNLPSVWMFTRKGTYKPVDDLQAMVEGVIGKDTGREIIIYCDTGKLASTWWFVLSEMLGYRNVKMYDGSFQEFSQNPNLPMEKYSWK